MAVVPIDSRRPGASNGTNPTPPVSILTDIQVIQPQPLPQPRTQFKRARDVDHVAAFRDRPVKAHRPHQIGLDQLQRRAIATATATVIATATASVVATATASATDFGCEL
jgi:hypothetical protein